MLCQIDECANVNDGQRLRGARKRKGLTLKRLAEELGIDFTYLSRVERNDRRMYTELADRAAAVLGVQRSEILSEDDNPTVAIVGYVGAGEQVHNLENPGEGIGRRQLDGVAWTPRLVGLVVRGESMLGRCDEGDILLFERTDVVDQDSIGRVSVVQVKDGPTYVKELYRGPGGRFTLTSRRGAPIVDVEVLWSARVRAYLPK